MIVVEDPRYSRRRHAGFFGDVMDGNAHERSVLDEYLEDVSRTTWPDEWV
jgi:hypothetical protein